MNRSVLLYAKTKLISANNGVGGPDDETQLMNPYDSPMLVDEVHVRNQYRAGVGYSVDNVSLRMSIGRARLTNDFIPIKYLAREYSEQTDGTQIIRFPRPLYVPRGTKLDIQARIDANAPLRVDLAIVARALPETYADPKVVLAPWWQQYTFAAVAEADGYVTKKTNAADLVNPFGAPLNVTGLLGDARSTNYILGIFVPTKSQAGVAIKLHDARGRPIIRDFTPFPALIDPAENDWKFRFTLPPKTPVFATLAANTSGGFGTITPTIVLAGWREVPIQEVLTR